MNIRKLRQRETAEQPFKQSAFNVNGGLLCGVRGVATLPPGTKKPGAGFAPGLLHR
jgi:hypothetical protein